MITKLKAVLIFFLGLMAVLAYSSLMLGTFVSIFGYEWWLA